MTDIYDLIVIGAGSAGLTAGAFNGELGRKVAVIEREHIGGDCTWTGCMPSKALLHVAKTAHSVRTASKYGITASEPVIDMKQVRDYVQSVVQGVYKHETPEKISERGIEVVLGDARFIDANTIQVNERQMQSKKFIIATGGRPAVPPIPGLDTVPYKTNRDFFENDILPQHLLIMGAGPIGMEMGQAYRRLGADVTIIGDLIMQNDEPEAVDVIKHVFEDEGITLIQSLVTDVQNKDGQICLSLKNGQSVNGDMLLVAVGRVPNVELDLEKAGIDYSKKGIPVNDTLQTNIPHIYAIGDVTTGAKFTHYAGFQGSVAGRNVLLPIGKAKGITDNLPWVTFTDPEVAHAGLTESKAREQYGDDVKTFMFQLADGDRSVAEDDTEGFIKFVYRGRGDLLGATIVGDRAGEMLLEYQLLIENKMKTRQLIDVIHAYPTYSDVAKKALGKMLIEELMSSSVGTIAKKVVNILP